MTNDQHQPPNIPAGDIPQPGASRPRTRRTPATSRDIPRRSRTADDLLAISWRLEPRDYVIAHLLAEHRYLTTDQIAAVLFTSPRTCRNRLNTLRNMGFIDWFMPVRAGRGRQPVHWVPGRLSTRYVALYHGEPAPSPRAMREQRDSYPTEATKIGHLDHHDGVNQFFIDLLVHTRSHPDSQLARWWPAGRTYQKVNHNTRPDAHGVWREGDREVAFFLEHDTGTEDHTVRAAKLTGYLTLRNNSMPWPVLFWLPTTAIETNLHRHLARGTHGVLVATAGRDRAAQHGGPAGPVWKVVGNGRRRLRLSELPGPVGPSGIAYHPDPPEPDEDPLYLLHDHPGRTLT